MKKFIFGSLLLGAMALMPSCASSFDIKDILGKSGDAVEGLVDGLFTQTNLSVEQLAGTWTATGSAVSFQSENLLKKAGGGAVTNTIEKKLDSYYSKLGLTGGQLKIDKDGAFQLTIKKMTLKGTITKRDDGNFDFTFTPFGNVKLGSVKTYVEKTTKGLNVMFDASKLQSILNTISGIAGNSTLSSVTNLLNGYDGICVGFAMKK